MRIIKEPTIKNDHSDLFNFVKVLKSVKRLINIARSIMVNELITGAITGPTQDTGIRKRMSQVSSDSGQLINNFKKT